MLTEEEIRQALHAGRVVEHGVINPHGPLGLEHLADVVKRIQEGPGGNGAFVRRYLDLPIQTWEKLDRIAAVASQTADRAVGASEVAAGLLEQSLAGK